LQQNPEITTVFIEFSNNYIDEAIDDWMWGKSYLPAVYPRYSSFMKIRDKRLLISKNLTGFISAYSISLKERFEQITKSNYDYSNKMGGYLYLVRDKTDSLLNFPGDSTERGRFFKDVKKVSESNLYELRRLIKMVREHQRRVILIRSPLHKKYPGFRNESKFREILKRDFGQLEFLDFSGFPLTNSEFVDLGHLNYKGARYFSIHFNNMLTRVLLQMENKQEFIDREILRIRMERSQNVNYTETR
jgi:hypothetical protein